LQLDSALLDVERVRTKPTWLCLRPKLPVHFTSRRSFILQKQSLVEFRINSQPSDLAAGPTPDGFLPKRHPSKKPHKERGVTPIPDPLSGFLNLSVVS